MLKETEINIGFFLSEPVTVLTNLFIGISCLYFYIKIRRLKNKNALLLNWMFFFLWIGLSAFTGGIHHGLKNHFPTSIQNIIKAGVNLSSLPASFHLLLVSIVISPLAPKLKENLQRVSFWFITALVPLTIYINEFYLVKIVAGIVILISVITHLHSKKKENLNGSAWVAYGFLFSLSSIVVHTTKFSISDWFNFKDISHVIMNISLIIIFIGVWKQAESLQEIENQA